MAPLPGFSFPSGSSKVPPTGTPKPPPSSSSSSRFFNPDTDILQLESASSSKGKGASLSQQSILKPLSSQASTSSLAQLAPYPTPPSNKRLGPGSEPDFSASVVHLPDPSSFKKPRTSSPQKEGAGRGAPSFSPVASGSQSTRISQSPLKQLCVPVVREDGRTVFDLLSSDEENQDDDQNEDENENDKNDATLVVSPSTAGQVSIRRSTSSSAHSPISLGPPSQEPEEIEAAPVSALTGKKLSLNAQGKQRAVDPEPRPKKTSVAKKTTTSSSAPRRRLRSSDSDRDMDVDFSPVAEASNKRGRAPPTSPHFLGARKSTGLSHHLSSSSLDRPSLPLVPPPSLPVRICQPDLADQLFSDSDKTSDDGDENDPYLSLLSGVPTPVGPPIPSTEKVELSHDLSSEEIRSRFADGQRHRGPRTVQRFEEMMRQSRENEGHRSCEIRVVNEIDPETDPTPSFEFTYIDRYLYGSNVPRAAFQTGCGCKGSCNPRSATCVCLREQSRHLPEGEEGFAYDEQGLMRFEGCYIWECSENCGCDESCMNRVAQRGTDADLAIIKTEKKGWGVEARSKILKNQYLSIYAGEVLNSKEAQWRGNHYDDVLGRTYLYDVDFERRKSKISKAQEKSMVTVDAFHAGNFTRYLNHSCDPNVRMESVFYRDYNRFRPFIAFFASRDIEIGDEICISYHGNDHGEEKEGKVREVTQVDDTTSVVVVKSAATGTVETSTRISNLEQACHCGVPQCRKTMFRLVPATDENENENEDDEEDEDEINDDDSDFEPPPKRQHPRGYRHGTARLGGRK